MAAVSLSSPSAAPPAWLPLSPGVSALPALSDEDVLGASWLLDHEAASVPHWDDGDASPSAAVPAPPLSAVQWRCLDSSHDSACDRHAHSARGARCDPHTTRRAKSAKA